ncbi:hypothetical protein C3R30_21140, partial [Mycobacterium tuberculosis]
QARGGSDRRDGAEPEASAGREDGDGSGGEHRGGGRGSGAARKADGRESPTSARRGREARARAESEPSHP